MIINQQHVPDVLMIGAAKSGTTSLYQYLIQHPSVYFPTHKKEPFYFSFGGEKPTYTNSEFVKNIIWKTDEYLDLYKNASPNQILIDGSTSYLYTSAKTIENVKKIYGDTYQNIKILCILRHPIERAFSHYTYLVRNGHEHLSFEEAIQEQTIQQRKNIRWGYDYLEYGMYYKQLQPFFDSFKNMKVYLFEDLKNSQILMSDIFHFLEIPNLEINTQFISNPSGIPKNKTVLKAIKGNFITQSMRKILPHRLVQKLKITRDQWMKNILIKQTISPKTWNMLLPHYKNDILSLEKLIHRDLKHWLNER